MCCNLGGEIRQVYATLRGVVHVHLYFYCTHVWYIGRREHCRALVNKTPLNLPAEVGNVDPNPQAVENEDTAVVVVCVN